VANTLKSQGSALGAIRPAQSGPGAMSIAVGALRLLFIVGIIVFTLFPVLWIISAGLFQQPSTLPGQ